MIVDLVRTPPTVTVVAGKGLPIPRGGGLPETFRVWPKTGSRPPAPPEVPTGYARYYNEAALILQDSPMASAALSRRCLQDLIENVAGITDRGLAKEIQALLDRKTLPSYLAEQVDGVRNIGKFAAHPIKSQVSGQVMDGKRSAGR